jgi:HEAT repeat protein
MKYRAGVYLLLFILAGPVLSLAGDDQTGRSTLDDWRDTLRFGINSEIVELLPTLTENREKDLLPEVLRLFRTTNNNDVITRALRYLQTIESPEGHERAFEIIDFHQDWNDDIIMANLEYLRETEASVSDDHRVVLEQIIRNRTVGPATGAVRLYAASDVSSDELIRLYREPDVHDEVRGRLLIELGDRGNPDVFDFVQEIIQEDEEATTTLQRYALDTLGKLGDERALPTIIRQFSSNDAMTRAYATSAVAQFDTPEAREALEGALRDEFWRVRVSALQAIGERGMTESVPAVVYKLRRDPERRVRLEAVKTLSLLDDGEGWSEMERLVRESSAGIDIRSAIIEQLLTHRGRQSGETIEALIDEEWDKENSRILDTIGRVISRAADSHDRNVIERLLNHPNFIIRIYAIRAIGNNGISSLGESLAEYSGEGTNRALRSAALRAMEQLGIDPDAVAPDDDGEDKDDGEDREDESDGGNAREEGAESS